MNASPTSRRGCESWPNWGRSTEAAQLHTGADWVPAWSGVTWGGMSHSPPHPSKLPLSRYLEGSCSPCSLEYSNMTAVAVWLQFDCCVTALGWEAVGIGNLQVHLPLAERPGTRFGKCFGHPIHNTFWKLIMSAFILCLLYCMVKRGADRRKIALNDKVQKIH